MSLVLGTTKEKTPASIQARVQETETEDKYSWEPGGCSGVVWCHGDRWGPDFPGLLKMQTGTWQDFQKQLSNIGT